MTHGHEVSKRFLKKFGRLPRGGESWIVEELDVLADKIIDTVTALSILSDSLGQVTQKPKGKKK